VLPYQSRRQSRFDPLLVQTCEAEQFPIQQPGACQHI
jgi:hypothetical protein